MGTVSVDQILITKLNRISVEGGDVLHGIKRCDPGYRDFGEAYFSFVNKDVIKAWKRHLRMTLNLMAPVGSICFVFMDDFGCFRTELINSQRYVRITVPPGIWFGFMGLVDPYSVLLNVADIPHENNEIERKSINEINFNWGIFK